MAPSLPLSNSETDETQGLCALARVNCDARAVPCRYALGSYRATLAISNQLTTASDDNGQWQRDLAINQGK